MFEDLVPSAQAETPAPPPGLFDDLIPAGAAAGRAGGIVAQPPALDASVPGGESAKAGDRDAPAIPSPGLPKAGNGSSSPRAPFEEGAGTPRQSGAATGDGAPHPQYEPVPD